MATILATPTNDQLAASLATLRDQVQSQQQVLTEMSAEQDEPLPVISQEEISAKKENLKKIFAIYTRRTKIVSFLKDREGNAQLMCTNRHETCGKQFRITRQMALN